MASKDKGGVRRNAKGGVLVKSSDLQSLMELFDRSGKGYITPSDVVSVGKVFFPGMNDADVRAMMSRRSKMTEESLAELLCDNDLQGYDPVEEAFGVLAKGGDAIEPAALKEVLLKLGVRHVTDEDMRALLRHADADRDDRLGLEDFRGMAGLH